MRACLKRLSLRRLSGIIGHYEFSHTPGDTPYNGRARKLRLFQASVRILNEHLCS